MKPLTVFCSLLNELRLTRRTPHHHRHHSPQNPRLTSYICVPLFFFLHTDMVMILTVTVDVSMMSQTEMMMMIKNNKQQQEEDE